MKLSISLHGQKELFEQFMQLVNIVEDPMEDKLLEIAQGLSNEIKASVPAGPTGNLKKSIVARKFKKKRKGFPATYVAVDRKIAPHSHLVEFGTKRARFPKGKMLKFTIDGKTIFAKQVAAMPAKPFFRPTVDQEQFRIVEKIKEGAVQLIEKVAGR